MRRVALLLLGLVACGLLVDVGTARPASAHATVVTTSPGEGARLEAAPDEVTLTFDEGISLGAGYARVLGAGGDRVDTGAATVSDTTITVPLRADLPDASYVVTYRVVSADSHPVSGAYAFVVGDGELVAATDVDAGSDVDPVVGALLPVARWVGFAGLALGVGVPVFLVACWPAGWAAPRARRMTLAGLAAVGVGGLLSFLLQGPYAAAVGLTGVVDPQLLSTTAGSAYGATLLVRVVLAAGLAAVAVLAFRGRPTVPLLAGGGVLGSGLVLSTAAVGHPVAGALPGLAVVVTTVHVAAMTAWLGGLAVLLAVVLRPGVAAGGLATALPRYSRLAAGSVAALVVTGVVQSVREVGTLGALLSTTYGWVLVAKLVLVLGLLAVAGVSRVWVQQRLGAPRTSSRRVVAHAYSEDADDEDPAARGRAEAAVAEVGPFRRSVLIELAVAAVVLALSAVLVGTPPAKAAVADPVDVTLPLESATGTDGSVQLSLDPASPGPNTLHVYLFDDTGQLTQPQALRVTLTEAQQQIGPLDVDLEPAGPGHTIGDAQVPTAGTWTLTVTVRLDEFTALTAATTFPVR
ncbi:copper resistance protein CopC [Modestobacter sp. Leaf380]|uniref:copper resistance CopC/CopD family protein n=1 Tax=Modestobacter sp. Leaf380 TaxID=1736356 RepID=UPI0006F2BE74|nr:copper resistance protein CopC [Modestobacter sp. Leaf380]KQS65993.1 copper resistance protein CopC [Modestobacter sp. Leaf380]